MPEGEKPGVFISHVSADAKLANALGTLVRKVFAGAITPWFSSDQSPRGGIKPGEPWWDRIHKELNGAAQVFAVVTPRSTGRPWIYWEAGIGSIACKGQVAPIAFRVDIAKLGPPLSYFEAIDGLNPASLTQGMMRVGAAADLNPDEEIVAQCVDEFIGAAGAELEGVEAAAESHVPDPVAVLYGPLQNIAERLERLDSISGRLSSLESPRFEGMLMSIYEMLQSLVRRPDERRPEDAYEQDFTSALHGSDRAVRSIVAGIGRDVVSPDRLLHMLKRAEQSMPSGERMHSAEDVYERIMRMIRGHSSSPTERR